MDVIIIYYFSSIWYENHAAHKPISPITEAKNRLLHLIREIDEKDEVLTITRSGVPVAVMLSPERYEGLLETIELLADPRGNAVADSLIEDSQADRWVSEENQVFGEDQA